MKNEANQSYYITIDNQKIPVTEEVYRAYKRPMWAEHKRREREKRCIGENGARCTGDCSQCTQQRIGSVLSLDWLEENGYGVADTTDLETACIDSLLLKELLTALEEMTPDNRLIMRLFAEGRSERDIATVVGLSQKGVNRRKAKLLEQLRERLKDYK